MTARKGVESHRPLRSKTGAAHDNGKARRHAVIVLQISGERKITNISKQVNNRTEMIPLIPANSSV
jgi:hypothetical protein